MILKKYLFILCLFCISACSESERSSIAFGLNTAPVTLDPRFATDAVSYRITRLIYQSMVDFDDEFKMVPSLTSWEQLALDHYRFSLINIDRRFHDGNLLTASDIKATYQSVLDPVTASPHKGSVAMIADMEVIDDQTIDFRLSQPDPIFPGRLVIGILPEKLINTKHDFNKQAIGSGPMQFVQWDNESRLTLQRIDDHQQIEFITVKDPIVRVLKLLKGEIDLVQGNLPPEIVSWLDENDSILVEKEHGDTFTYLGFNLEDSVTGNELIRKAIAHAIDRKAIIHYVMGESARLAGAIFTPDHWAGHPELNGFEYDPEESKRLLRQAGYDKKPLKLVFKTSNNPFRLRLATIIQDQMKQVGIDMEIRSYDWGTFYADIKAGRFQMFSLSWVGLKMPDIFRYVFHSHSVPPNGANRGRFDNALVDSLIKTAEFEPSLEKQADYYYQLQELLFDALPYVPLWYEDNVLAIRKDIQGYRLSPDGNFDSLTNTKRLIQ